MIMTPQRLRQSPRLLLLGAAALLAGTLWADGVSVQRPLLDAVKHGDHSALRSLLEKKVDVNAAEPDGSTPLHWAVYQSDAEAVDLLLRAGARPNAANDLGATPLWL